MKGLVVGRIRQVEKILAPFDGNLAGFLEGNGTGYHVGFVGVLEQPLSGDFDGGILLPVFEVLLDPSHTAHVEVAACITIVVAGCFPTVFVICGFCKLGSCHAVGIDIGG